MSGVAGRDHIGVGVGAVVLDAAGRVFLARRGPEVRNEAGCWEFPGGMVGFGETLSAAVRREFDEEYGMTIEVVALLGVADHILPAEGQHWVSPGYLARHIGGEPTIREPGKCTAIGWYALDALPEPLSEVSRSTLASYRTWEAT
jgi:8-oxo-dGTP diphosphatase